MGISTLTIVLKEISLCKANKHSIRVEQYCFKSIPVFCFKKICHATCKSFHDFQENPKS